MGLADIALAAGRTSGARTNLANIIEFVESGWGLNMSLFPVQRVILKAHYGIPLDDTVRFPVGDWRRQNFRQMTEAEYLRMLFDEGRCNIREVEPGRERREMVLSIGRRSGKCVEGESLVLTDRGIIRIESLGDPHGPEIQPLEIGIAQEGATRARAAYFYNGGVKSVRRFKTWCGYELGGTGNHRVKILTPAGVVDWKYLADIQVGDQIAIHRGTDLWASEYVDVRPYHNQLGLKKTHFPPTLDERWGLLLGCLTGDGSWPPRNMTSMTVEHPETWDDMKSLFTELFGGYGVTPDKRTANTGRIAYHGVAMRRFLHDLGWSWDCAWDTKSIPWVILKSPRSVVCAYLRGLFETDGGVESGGKVVSFSTASRRLAGEVQVILLNIGIVSRVKEKWVKGKPYYMLTVRGLRSRKLFAECVGFMTVKKNHPLRAGLTHVGREGGATESIPHQRDWTTRLLHSVPKNNPKRRQNGWRRSVLRAALGNTIKPGSGEDLTYARMAAALPVAESLGADPEVLDHFRQLAALDYFYDPVVSATDGEAPVYDLNVPEGASFVANGMVNHNTTLAACISAYETYKLLSKGDPQAFYGLPSSNNIQIISVATDKDQAGLLYAEVSGHFRSCAFFAPYTANNTMTYARFQTPKDIERYGSYADNPSAKASIKITFRSCIAKGLRGAGNIVVILDEMAHFTDDGQSSAEKVYDAVTPSTSAFSAKDPNDNRIPIGEVEGRIISISSPLGKQGTFYRLYSLGFKSQALASKMLCIQAPTWEVNPTIPAEEFEKHFLKNPIVFFTEYGGEFTDRTRGWIERAEDLELCIDPNARPQQAAPARRPHFVGIDVALVNDASAIAIGHLDEHGRVVTDLVDQIKAGEGDYKGVERLEFDDVVEWIYQYSRKFFFAEGLFDQWAGIPFEQSLHKRGLKQLNSEFMTKPLNSQIFQNFKDMMWDKRLILYDWPKRTGQTHCDYIAELLELQAEIHSKYVTDVHAPDLEGKHDDRSDALVRMVWVASKHASKSGYLSRGTNPKSVRGLHGGNPMSAAEVHRALHKARRSGSSPDRLVPQGAGFRSRGTAFKPIPRHGWRRGH